jgi:hypothetical protein
MVLNNRKLSEGLFAKREKDAEEASDNFSKETKQDKDLNETGTASKEEWEAVATKATVEEAKVDTDEESKSESEKSVKVVQNL